MGRRQPSRVRNRGFDRHRPTAAPPGRAPVAEDHNWRRETWAAWCSGAALAGVLVLIDLARGGLCWGHGGCWAALGALLVLVLLPQRVTAGDGWLATRGLLHERRVRTDLLTRVRRSDGITPRIVLGDAGGGRVEIDPQVFVANPLIWHYVDTGARHSRRSGLLREGAPELKALADRIDGEGARSLLEASGLD
jgi:hypothetical protein